jgi:hypothetical protein
VGRDRLLEQIPSAVFREVLLIGRLREFVRALVDQRDDGRPVTPAPQLREVEVDRRRLGIDKACRR